VLPAQRLIIPSQNSFTKIDIEHEPQSPPTSVFFPPVCALQIEDALKEQYGPLNCAMYVI
jgi:hypothetical protein